VIVAASPIIHTKAPKEGRGNTGAAGMTAGMAGPRFAFTAERPAGLIKAGFRARQRLKPRFKAKWDSALNAHTKSFPSFTPMNRRLSQRDLFAGLFTPPTGTCPNQPTGLTDFSIWNVYKCFARHGVDSSGPVAKSRC
jgi:hypothetical protein